MYRPNPPIMGQSSLQCQRIILQKRTRREESKTPRLPLSFHASCSEWSSFHEPYPPRKRPAMHLLLRPMQRKRKREKENSTRRHCSWYPKWKSYANTRTTRRFPSTICGNREQDPQPGSRTLAANGNSQKDANPSRLCSNIRRALLDSAKDPPVRDRELATICLGGPAVLVA